jgi:hypothetical protein
MSDALVVLPPFTWRGVQYPVTERHVSFSHESATSKIQYQNGELIQQTGARNTTLSYTLAMRQDIAVGPFRDLFARGLPALFRDMRNREEGPLFDPVYGAFTCVPSSFNDDMDVLKRDGTDVKVEFTESPALDSEATPPATLQDIASDGGALEGEIELVDWQQQPSPEGTTDLLSAINGAIFQGFRAVNRVSAQLNNYASKLEKLEDTVDLTTNPRNWPVKRDLRRMRDVVLRASAFGDTPGEARKTKRTQSAQPISALASSLGLSVSQLLILNPSLATTPIVPAGTTIRIPAQSPLQLSGL